jgi:hypothetical protein
MKTFMTTAVIVAALTLPAFAEGEDASTKAGEAKGNVKATTEQKQEPIGSNAMGQGAAVPRATTGASRTDQLNKEESSSPANPGRKTGVTGGGDDSGGGGSGSGGGGSGGGGGGGGNR